MAAPVVVNLPFPPTANKLWRFVPGVRNPLKSALYRAWLIAARNDIPEALRGAVRGPHRLDIAVDRPSRRSMDLDNRLKPTLDAIKDHVEGKALIRQGVIRDDSDTQSITIRWTGDEPVKDPRVTVCVFPE